MSIFVDLFVEMADKFTEKHQIGFNKYGRCAKISTNLNITVKIVEGKGNYPNYKKVSIE
jgi:hypothetical protein